MYLLQDGRKISKKKTAVKRGDTNPVFNEAMIFSVPAIVLQVWPSPGGLGREDTSQCSSRSPNPLVGSSWGCGILGAVGVVGVWVWFGADVWGLFGEMWMCGNGCWRGDV